MNGTRDVLYLGLPSSGKTTYVALLYRAIATRTAAGLELGSYGDDREYVNDIAKRLAKCEEAERTQTDHDEQLALSLRASGNEMFLRVPDMSGERWSHVIEDRKWSLEIDRYVVDATGFVIFVHSDSIDTEPLIDDVEAGAALLAPGDPDDEKPDPAAGAVEDTADERPRSRATQVALVDLIQLVVQRHPRVPMRLSIVASAWDLMPKTLAPRDWLSDELPLLQQYLETNAARIESSIWGVSAQGGDFGDKELRDELLRKDVVARALVKSGAGDDSTVVAPMEWALGLG